MDRSVRLPDAESPWLETPSGWLFFLNLLMATPALVVLFPVAVGGFLRGVGLVGGEFSPYLDTIPWVVSYAVPYVGWLTLIPLVTIARNLRMAIPSWARRMLWAFAVVHVMVLGMAALHWVR